MPTFCLFFCFIYLLVYFSLVLLIGSEPFIGRRNEINTGLLKVSEGLISA